MKKSLLIIGSLSVLTLTLLTSSQVFAAWGPAFCDIVSSEASALTNAIADYNDGNEAQRLCKTAIRFKKRVRLDMTRGIEITQLPPEGFQYGTAIRRCDPDTEEGCPENLRAEDIVIDFSKVLLNNGDCPIKVYQGANVDFVNLTLIVKNKDKAICTGAGNPIPLNNQNNPYAYIHSNVIIRQSTPTPPRQLNCFKDEDGDTFGNPNQPIACDINHAITDNTDCDDTNKKINPNTIWFPDNDGDGLVVDAPSEPSCTRPSDKHRLRSIIGDCDDTNALKRSVLSPDICGDNIDNNCNGRTDEGCFNLDIIRQIDFDKDDDGSPIGEDCNDNDATIHPEATDICGDDIDQDCDGQDDVCPEPECTPTTEVCGDGLDQDCNGTDLVCPETPDCTPTTEICDDGIDQDCNGSDLACPDPDEDDDPLKGNRNSDSGGCALNQTNSQHKAVMGVLILTLLTLLMGQRILRTKSNSN